MSDEDSFVILSNCSPSHSNAECFEYGEDNENSMEHNFHMPTLQEKDVTTMQPEMTDTLTKNGNSLTDTDLSGSSNSGQDIIHSGVAVKGIEPNSSRNHNEQDIKRSTETAKATQANSTNDSNSQDAIKRSTEAANSMQASSINGQPRVSVDKSLAASFILGEIPADVLRSSIHSQFPSLCQSMETWPEEFLKFQGVCNLYMQFKDVTTKLNKITKDLKGQVDALRNENSKLKQDIYTNSEQMRILEKIRQDDHTELLKIISEKTSQIGNMHSLIEKLQQQQLASYEYVVKHENDVKDKPDYVERLEHQRVVKDMDRKISELVADNLNMKEMEKQYVDEINCLKVNLTAAEELVKQSRADINLLKAKDMEKLEMCDQMKDEIALLRTQIDVYSKDFEMERNARQSIAGDKDQLLQDLRALQRKNQELIEEAQKQWENIEKCTASAANLRTGSSASINAAITNAAVYERNSPHRPIRELPPPSSSSNSSNSAMLSSNYNTHRCPVCLKTYKSLTLLQSHVNMCLDKK